MNDNPQFVIVPDTGLVVVPQHDLDVLIEEVVTSVIVTTTDSESVVLDAGDSIVTELQEISVVTVGEAGPPGAAGAPGVGGTVAKTAAIALGGQRVVVPDSSGNMIYADCSILAHRDKVLGLTTGAVSAGAQATIVTYGEMIEPSWNWTLDSLVFLSTNGMLTQAEPLSGFSQRIGFPTGTTKLFIDIDAAITL